MYGLPAIYFNANYFAESGGLFTYGDNYAEECRLTAGCIDRILKSAKFPHSYLPSNAFAPSSGNLICLV
jgi:hypothetical protein